MTFSQFSIGSSIPPSRVSALHLHHQDALVLAYLQGVKYQHSQSSHWGDQSLWLPLPFFIVPNVWLLEPSCHMLLVSGLETNKYNEDDSKRGI